jgi:hypothetical protein
MATWNTTWDFVVDLIKKEIVAVVTGLLTAVATFIYASTIVPAVSTFAWDWWGEYWYLVVICSLVVLLEAYLLYNYQRLFPWLVIVTIIIGAIFALYRMHSFPENWPLSPFFCVFLILLLNVAVIVWFLVWRAVMKMRAPP